MCILLYHRFLFYLSLFIFNSPVLNINSDSNNIKIAENFNFYGFKSNISDIQQSCDDDFVLLQELWLLPVIHQDFKGICLSLIDKGEKVLVGRLHGGGSILICKSLSKFVAFCMCDNSKLIGIEHKHMHCYLFINIYFPFFSD